MASIRVLVAVRRQVLGVLSHSRLKLQQIVSLLLLASPPCSCIQRKRLTLLQFFADDPYPNVFFRSSVLMMTESSHTAFLPVTLTYVIGGTGICNRSYYYSELSWYLPLWKFVTDPCADVVFSSRNKSSSISHVARCGTLEGVVVKSIFYLGHQVETPTAVYLTLEERHCPHLFLLTHGSHYPVQYGNAYAMNWHQLELHTGFCALQLSLVFWTLI